MDMKTLKEFMNSSNSIYLILPPVALWAVTPFFGTGAMFAALELPRLPSRCWQSKIIMMKGTQIRG